jgi:hypothetical protein
MTTAPNHAYLFYNLIEGFTQTHYDILFLIGCRM